MTDDEMRIFIAEACGWKKNAAPHSAVCLDWQDNSGRTAHSPPDYLNDFNAMYEAEKVLDHTRWDAYVANLLDQVRGQGSQPREISACHATARQRAEAFIKTLKKT